MRRPPTPRPGRRAARGIALLEVLVAILIFSVGVLGIVGLQLSMTKAQTASKYRGEAAYLAQEMIGTIWSDMPNVGQYTDGGCGSYALCKALQDKVQARLPAGTVAFVTDATTGQVVITLGWTAPGESASTYTTSSAVQQ